MNARSSAALVALLLYLQAGPATAQPDDHAQAITRANCQKGKQSEAVTSATAQLERDPDELGPRLRLADALVDQGCYQEAVAVLEAGQQSHPRSGELSGKLRDVRSLVTEQTYIEGLTQAAEGAKFQRNQLRCTRLADITACEDALKFKPDDPPLLMAKGDALIQANRAADAVAAFRHAVQLKPGDEVLKTKLGAAEVLQASATPLVPTGEAQVASADTAARGKPRAAKRAPATAPASASASSSASVANAGAVRGTAAGSGSAAAAGSNTARSPAGAAALAGAPVLAGARAPVGGAGRAPAGGEAAAATVASLEAQAARTYSNDAPAGQTN